MTVGNYLGSTQGAQVKGTTTNDNADAGDVGETISSAVATVNAPTSNQWGDLTSINLTAGDWLIFANLGQFNPPTTTHQEIGISTTSGNSATGLVSGDNNLATGVTSGQDASLTIAGYRASLSGSATYYLKMLATYTGTAATNAFWGRITAVRIR